MINRIIIAIVFITAGIFANAQSSSTLNSKIERVSAQQVKAMMDSSEGPLIVNFWATWCGPCVRELTYFDSIITEKKIPIRLLLVSLDFAESYPAKLTAFVKKRGYKGQVVYLHESNADKFIPAIEPNWNGAIPASIILDNSKKYYKLFNHQLTKERLSLELDNLLR